MTEVNKLERLGKVVKTDVLIIGGGPSGLWAAFKAKPLVDNVIVVDKGPVVGPTCAGYFSGGGLDAVLDEEDINSFVEEMVYFEDGLVEQDTLEAIGRQSLGRLQDLERFGCTFFKNASGQFTGTPQRGLKHVVMYTQKPFGIGGKNIINGLIKEGKRQGVRYMSQIYITDILKKDGKANGALGFNTRTGEFYIFKAKGIILCTGNGNIRSHYQDMGMSTGDGIRMALQAGCELRNLEFVTLWVVPKLFGWAGITNLLPMGAKFVNAKGENFVDKYSPVLKSNCDFNYLSMFMALEARNGKGPFYLDCSPMKLEDRDIMQPRGGWTKLQYGKLLDMGIKFFDDKTEWMPGFWGTMGGSVKTNQNMESCIPGLYIAGRLRSMDTGIYLGGWALATCAAFGCWAGENAAKYAQFSKFTEIDEARVSQLKQDIYAPLGKAGIEPEEIIQRLQKAIFPYDVILLKTEKTLTNALKTVDKIRDELLPQMGARDIHYLKKLLEVKSMTLVAELILSASLMRTESRASHYREDCPKRDDKNWLKWIIIRKTEDKLNLVTEPVPFEKYKFQPTRFYSDNFTLLNKQ